MHLVRGLDLGHLGIDVRAAVLPRQGHAVMAVVDEVEATGLVDRDRWHRAVAERLTQGVEPIQRDLVRQPPAGREPVAQDAEGLSRIGPAMNAGTAYRIPSETSHASQSRSRSTTKRRMRQDP